MGVGKASGEKRAEDAVRMAISSPLLETTIDGARGVLINVTGGPDLGIFEINNAAMMVTEAADPNANIIFGATVDPNMKDEVSITVIATGFEGVSSVAAGKAGNLFSGGANFKAGDLSRGASAGATAQTPGDVEIPWFLRDKK